MKEILPEIEAWRRQGELHVLILEAIQSGDSARAGAEARNHVRRTERVVRRRTRSK